MAVRSWGKHFLLEFDVFALRIHWLMFGSYRINERKPEAVPRLGLGFADGAEFNSSTCFVRYIKGALDAAFNDGDDVLWDAWNLAAAHQKLRAVPDTLVCDALLDQTVFSGVGNIIRNEVLFRVLLHPLSTVGALPAAKLRAVVETALSIASTSGNGRRPLYSGSIGWGIRKGIARAAMFPSARRTAEKTGRLSFFYENYQTLNAQPTSKKRAAAVQSTQHDKMKFYHAGEVTG